MARVKIVKSTELSAKVLRASEYVPSPRRMARDIVARWTATYPVINIRSNAVKALQKSIEDALYETLRKK